VVFATVNQLDAKFILQVLQGNTQGGLGDVAFFGCTTEIQLVGKCHQIT
jgi:hypothetical protein